MTSVCDPATLSRFARFLVASGVGFILNILVTAAVHEVFRQPEEVAFGVAIVAVFFYYFFVSRHFIFRSTQGDPGRQFVKFLVSSGLFRVVQYASFLVIHTWMGVHYLVAAVLILGISFFAKFFFYGSVVFTNDDHATS